MDWAQQVSLWRRTAETRYSTVDRRVVTGPLGLVVSQAVALHPVDRASFYLTNDHDDQTLPWDGIFALSQRDDYPFSI